MNKSSISDLKFNENWILYLAFFALGFGKFIFYVPLFALYFFLKGAQTFSMPIRSSYLVLLCLMLFATLPLYTFGGARMTIDAPLKSLVPLLFILVVAGFVLQAKTQDLQFKLIVLYVLGFGFDALVLVGYSYWVDASRYGYNLLLNPLNGEEVNSPGASNTLSLMAAMLVFFLFQRLVLIKKLAVLLLLFVLLIAAFFLGGRSFFVILAASFLIVLMLDVKLVQLPKVFFYSAAILLFGLVFIFNLDFLSDKLAFTLLRLSHGLESEARFELYADGMSVFFDYPFGGFSVDTNLVSTKWFHNIFLDNARIGGWFPVLSLILAMMYIASAYFRKRNTYFVFAFLLFIVSVLIMQQDVVLEGNFRILMVMYFVGILLHAHQLSFKTTHNYSHAKLTGN
ncbi:MAG: hypothetical protein WD356_03385 [Pseudomonadales bacterium]